MFKKIKFNHPFSNDFQKIFLEKVFYLDNSITKILFKKNYIYFDSNQNKNISKIKKKIIFYVKKNLKNIDRTDDEILYEKNINIKNRKKDPFNEIIKKQYVKKISDGIYSLEGDLLILKKNLETLFQKQFASMKFNEVKYSGIVPVNSLIENSYLNSFPHHCLFISHVGRNLKKVNNISKLDNKNFYKIKHNLDHPRHIMSPTVCFNFFETFKNKKINNTVKVTAIENCHRHESLNYRSFERLNVYSMREWIILGAKKNIEKDLLIFLKKFKNLFYKLNLKFRICTASDPFFSNKDIKKKIFQQTNRLKYEIQLYLPYEKKWSAVASINNHLETMTKAYNIKFKNKKSISSGCIGIGYERLIYAIYSQKGIINNLWKKKF